MAAAKNQLVAALDAIFKKRPDLAPAAVAKDAGVAPTTLRKVRAGTFVRPNAIASADRRQIRGWVEALVRLTVYINESQLLPDVALKHEDVVAQFGLNLPPSNPRAKFVEGAIARVLAKQDTQIGLSDFVLQNIQNRATREDQRTRIVRAGILQWRPFSAVTFADSWSYKFCTRLLGSLNPGEWKPELAERESIEECLKKVLDGTDDVTFGIYDTVSRQLRGMEFIHLPGIGVPLHALYRRPSSAGKEVKWDDIAIPDTNRDRQFRVTALKGEIGELYIRGPCNYDLQNVTTLRVFGADEIANSLLKENYAADRTYVFVADRPTCKNVLEALGKIARQEAGEPRGVLAATFTEVSLASYDGKDFPNFPSYRLGLGYRANAERWERLLTTALQEEIFRNDIDWTVQQYLTLFRSYSLLSLVPLEPQLPPVIADVFAKKVEARLSELRGGDFPLDEATDLRLRSDLRKLWLKDHAGAAVSK